MDGTLDGKVATSDISGNFLGGLANTISELVQENYNLSAGAFAWSTGVAAASTASIYARIVLEYVDNSKSTNIFFDSFNSIKVELFLTILLYSFSKYIKSFFFIFNNLDSFTI